MISNGRRQRKIKNVLGVLREGTVDVRRNPTAQNYKHWETKIARAGRERSVVWVVVILSAGVLFIGVKIVSQISSTSPQNQASPSVCYLYNDNPNYEVVNIRANCDLRACGYDDSTIIGEYPNNTPVRVSNASGRKSGRFTWIQVVLIHNGQVVWIASTKVRC